VIRRSPALANGHGTRRRFDIWIVRLDTIPECEALEDTLNGRYETLAHEQAPRLKRGRWSGQTMSKPFLWSFASSCMWIGVAISMAYAVSPIHTTPLDAALNFAGGIIASPAIGALIGYVAWRFNRLTFGRRLLVALGDLYLATYLFLLAAGLGQILAQLLKGRAVDLQRSLVVDPLIGTLLGLTYTGFVLALFPLSYLNHVLIGKAWDHVRAQSAG
jgi:hypothetical protein